MSKPPRGERINVYSSSLKSITLTIAQAWEGGYPCVFKIGHAHGGLGKVKVENETGFEVGFQKKLPISNFFNNLHVLGPQGGCCCLQSILHRGKVC